MSQALRDQALAEFTRVVPRLYRRIQNIRLKIAREVSLSRGQMEILSLLAERGSLSLTEIATTLFIAKPNVTTAVEDLSQRALVEREPHPQDGRIILLKLSTQGHSIRQQIQQSFRSLVTASLSALDEAELAVLISGLQGLGTVVDRLHLEGPDTAEPKNPALPG